MLTCRASTTACRLIPKDHTLYLPLGGKRPHPFAQGPGLPLPDVSGASYTGLEKSGGTLLLGVFKF